MRRGRWAATLLVTGLLVTGLTGCGSVHSAHRAGGADVCAGALPAGQGVAGHTARLSRLRALNLRSTDDLLVDLGAAPLQPPANSPARAPTGRLCAVAYTGSFSADTLPSTIQHTGSTGSVLLLVITTRHAHVLRAVVLPTLPYQLGR